MTGAHKWDKTLLLLVLAILITPLLYFGLRWSTFQQRIDDDRVVIGTRHSLYSAVLEEDRDYLVYLPASYRDSMFMRQSYPVMYLLDGRMHFQSATGVVQFMSEGSNGNRQVPEMIVVAIANTNRTRDLTPTNTKRGYDGTEEDGLADSGGADRFLQFIREELFPKIEADYRTMPYRILVGHSFGGLLAMHALLDQPDMFQSYVAIDPSLWWDDQVLTSRARNVFQGDHGRRASVYISLANTPDLGLGDPALMEMSGRTFAYLLDEAATPSFRMTMQYFDQEDHPSVPLISLYHGLLSIFDGFKIPIDAIVDDPSYIVSHFENVSNMMGTRMLPPESLVNELGYFLLYPFEDPDKAVEMFRVNVGNYPESANVYDSLAEALHVRGDEDLAIENYEMSLKLNPRNENAKMQLEALTD
jgi:predicted alpha/beta superfamily hydrolase